jgi:YD repeat-containing protein
MPQTSFIQRARLVDSNGSDYSTSNGLPVTLTSQTISVDVQVEDQVSVFQNTASDLRVEVRPYFQNQTVSIAYSAVNNATQIVETRDGQTRTTSLVYDASNNVTSMTENVV